MKVLSEYVTYDSSTVSASTYDFKNHNLIVEFVSGTDYYFQNVDESDYESFRDSDSIGKSFNKYIKKYGGERMKDE